MPSIAPRWYVGAPIVTVEPRFPTTCTVFLIEADVNRVSIRKAVPTQPVTAARSKQVIRASFPVAIVTAIYVVATVCTDELELEIVPPSAEPPIVV